MMPFSLLIFGDSHQALAGLVRTLAWSTMLAYSGSAGYITSRGGALINQTSSGLVSTLAWSALNRCSAGVSWLRYSGSGCFTRIGHKQRRHGFGKLRVLIFFVFKVYWQSRLSSCKGLALQLWLYVSLLSSEARNST